MTHKTTHPAAEIFPLMEGAEFAALVADIQEHGLREPIILHDGMILDGRNRYRACMQIGAAPKFQPWDREGTPEAFVVSMNLHRRHLNESQRGMIAAQLATAKRGANQHVGISTPSQKEAAELLNVSRDTVLAARIVQNEGTPEQVKAVEDGRAAVSTTARKILNLAPKMSGHKKKASIAQEGKNPTRIENQRIRAEIWGRVRDTLIHLTSLPVTADAVRIVREMDKAGLVDAKLGASLQWLKEFENGWRNRDQKVA